MKKSEYIIIGLVIIMGCVGLGLYMHYHKHITLAPLQASNASTQSIPVESQPVPQVNTKQELQDCINQANQQEISQLQQEKDTLAQDNADGTSFDNDSVNSYIQEIQQQAQTQITECQAEY